MHVMNEIAADLARFNRSDLERNLAFRREHPFWWWFTLVGPVPVTLIVLALLWLEHGAEFVWQLVATALATFFLFDRFVILGGHR